MTLRKSAKKDSWITTRRRFWPASSLVLLLTPLILVGCTSSKEQTSQPAAPPAENKAVAAPVAGYAVGEVTGGGSIEGRVLFRGKPPAPRLVVVDQDVSTCGKRREVYPVRLDRGGVADAVVWIDDIPQGKPFGFPAPVLDQKGCDYVPHIVLMQPGELTVETGDPVPHNVHTYAKSNRDYNESMNPLNRRITLSLSRADLVSVKCDLHGWMQAYVVVAKNPYYAVTGRGGAFALRDVPPGRYHLKVWQETLGTAEQELAVEAGKPTKVDFTFPADGAGAAEGR
jgi:Carboxypeptidase regulatory-like domain